jgi:hypothetical protein
MSRMSGSDVVSWAKIKNIMDDVDTSTNLQHQQDLDTKNSVSCHERQCDPVKFANILRGAYYQHSHGQRTNQTNESAGNQPISKHSKKDSLTLKIKAVASTIFNPENRGRMFLKSTPKHLPDYTASYTTKHYSS